MQMINVVLLLLLLLLLLQPSQAIAPPSRILRAFHRKQQTKDDTTDSHILTTDEAAAFITTNALDLLLLQQRRNDGSTTIDAADPECVVEEDESEYLDHTDEEWTVEIKKFQEKYPIVKVIPGVGILGMQSFSLKRFDGFIEFKITRERVRLLVHGSKGTSNCGQQSVTDMEKVNAMVLKVNIGKFEFLKKQKILETSRSVMNFFAKHEEWVTQVISLPLLSNVNVKIKIAIDANIVFENDQWTVKKGEDVSVCVPSVKAAGMSEWTIKMLTGGQLNLRKAISDHIFCTFKYTLPHQNTPLRSFLDFVRIQSGQKEEGDPLVEFSIKKLLEKTESVSNKLDFMTSLDVVTQFRMPTMPFIKFLVVKGAEATAHHVAHIGEEKEKERDIPAHMSPSKSKVSSDLGIDMETMQAAATELSAQMDEWAIAMNDQKNHAMASVVETVSNVVFDLDNDLAGVFQGSILLEDSENINVIVKQFSVTGKVTETKIPIALFVESIESLDGIEQVVTTSQANGKKDLASGIELTGLITLAKFEDVEITGKLRPFLGPKYKERVLQYLFGVRGALREFGEMFADFLLHHKATVSWTTTTGGETTTTKDKTMKRKIRQCSMDKRMIQISGVVHYNGPFQVNSIMTKLTHAANTAAADVASAKKEAEKLAMCMGDVDEEFEMELEKVVKSKKVAKLKCLFDN